MIISFVGHSSLVSCDNLVEEVKLAIFDNQIPNEKTIFYCGGYGDFDKLSAKACRQIQKQYKNCEIVFITPYLTPSQQKKNRDLIDAGLYDAILYPPIEHVPPKYAINKRNEWMIEQADLIIAYVNHTFGGAYKTLQYAQRKKKHIINLAK